MNKLSYDISKYHRTIVCDFDDTLSITNTKNWKNSEPNYSLINKLNKLYNEGWQIIILTARGQISCNGDVDKATEKYYDDITEWLNIHKVKYHQLIFNKYLAAYYVDDKSITPEDFCKLDIEVIKQGWSGAIVERRGDKIFKTHKDSINAALWYKLASPIINTPKVHTIIGDTLCMEYLVSNDKTFKISDIDDIVKTFSKYKYPIPDFENYIKRINSHVNHNNMFHFIIDLLEDYNFIEFMNNNKSFMHGDLSIDNIINTDKGLYLIDPIYEVDSFSSYLLDYTKLLCSYKLKNRDFEYSILYNNIILYVCDISQNFTVNNRKITAQFIKYIIDILEITQFIRIYKYIPEEDIKTKETVKNIINNTLSQYK